MGTEVPMTSFITEISSGRDLSDIYLRPANDSSEDEDGNEAYVSNADDEKEEENFQSFIAQHAAKEENKVKLSKVQEKN